MKAVLVDVPEDLLDRRRVSGADRWDEMWDGVLHMGPSPNRSHQRFEFLLHTWLEQYWVPSSGGKVFHQINLASVAGWPNDYRVPDLVLLTPERFAIDHNEYFEGPPSAVVEIRSPGDETYEKLPFYARLGVPEVWIFDRDTRAPQLHEFAAGAYQLKPIDASGWIGTGLGVQFKHQAPATLLLRLAGLDTATALTEGCATPRPE